MFTCLSILRVWESNQVSLDQGLMPHKISPLHRDIGERGVLCRHTDWQSYEESTLYYIGVAGDTLYIHKPWFASANGIVVEEHLAPRVLTISLYKHVL